MQNKKIKIISKLFKTKRFTILKSPHVNKTAQEQFEVNWFLINVQIDSFDISKFLIFNEKLEQLYF